MKYRIPYSMKNRDGNIISIWEYINDWILDDLKVLNLGIF